MKMSGSEKNVNKDRGYHGCPTALFTLTEQWTEDLDKHNIIGAIATDSSKNKAFDCLNFDVMLISQVVVVYNAVNEFADSDKEKCIVTFQYSETPPYGRLGNTVTSLLRPPFFGLVERSYIFL
ncbi:unnamed protein product [Porites evermanni]|uniref:Uncharacterized protein n=1 Tax=Porites evermanni TaxID=104178 RepID=A0ABN8LJI7_9CNID|nr:unnamed protein product [Porites evermanni]